MENSLDVEIVDFPETRIAVLEHHGDLALEHESVQKLIAWRIANKIPPSDKHRSYGIHYNDPTVVPKEEYRVDLGISYEAEIAENPYGVIGKVIPALRCAKARHIGSCNNVSVARDLYQVWLPQSNRKLADFPIFFHYVNVGPGIREEDMITDVYLPVL
ncbi:MAG: GyrI-like domain-containing protein [Spirochaetota bacterium]